MGVDRKLLSGADMKTDAKQGASKQSWLSGNDINLKLLIILDFNKANGQLANLHSTMKAANLIHKFRIKDEHYAKGK
jgi:hypothetical protein